MMVKPQFREIKKILVFNPSFIGDSVLTTPLIKALWKLFPMAGVDFCVRPESAPLFEGVEGLGIIEYDKRRKEKGVGGLMRFASSLRASKYDLVISPHKSLRTSLVLALSRIPVKIGYTQSAANRVYSYKVSRDMSLHEVERILALLEPLLEDYCLEAAKEMAGFPFTYTDFEYVDNLKREFKEITGGKKVVALTPGSAWKTKMWPAEYYGRLARRLHEGGYGVLIMGGPGDQEATEAVKKMLDFDYLDYANKIPFRYIPSVLKSVDLLVTNDSAPLHIAVSQQTPAVVIFGSTVPSQGFYPYDNMSIICENKGLYCRPCGRHGYNRCPEGHFRCMLEVGSDGVFEAAMDILEKMP